MNHLNDDTTVIVQTWQSDDGTLRIAPRSAQEAARSIIEPLGTMKVDEFVDAMVREGFTDEEAIHALQVLVLHRIAHVDDLRVLWTEKPERVVECPPHDACMESPRVVPASATLLDLIPQRWWPVIGVLACAVVAVPWFVGIWTLAGSVFGGGK